MNIENPCRWKTNLLRIQHRIKERFRVAIGTQKLWKQKSQMRGVGGTPVWRATGLAVARAFEENALMTKVARSMAKHELPKRGVWLHVWMPKLRSALGLSAVAAGATLSHGSQPAQAEALMSQHPVSGIDTKSINHQAGRKGKPEKYEDKAVATAREHSQIWRMLQAVVLPLVANSCRVFMHGLNRTEVYGAEKVEKALLYRPNGQALITVCNHVASMDDPLVMSTLLPHHLMLRAPQLRWTLCATDQCFSNAAFSAFFHSVKCLPVKRGGGLYQEGMDIAVRKVERGDWVHIFPEGGRSRDGGKTIGPVKRGVGRLLADVEKTPLLIPFVHFGMHELMPIGTKFPGAYKKVTVLVGDPIHLENLVNKHVQEGLSKSALYDAIALEVGQKMKQLKEELDQLVLQRSLQDAALAIKNVQVLQRVQGLCQFVDWEALGLSLEAPSREIPISCTQNRDTPQTILRERCLVDAQEDAKAILTLENSKMDEMRSSDQGLATIHGGLARLSAFIDPLSFLGLGFAARGFLNSAALFKKIPRSIDS